jgi:dipeptidyl aminopeptidase/acylaminoacyl peptidase
MTGAAKSGTKRPFSARDLVMLRRFQDAAVSPDGAQVAVVVRNTDFGANRGRSDIYLLSLDGSGAPSPLRSLTTHEENDTDPQWSGDGKSLFYSTLRDGKRVVARVNVQNGRHEVVVRLPVDVETFRVTADGRTVVFAAEVYPDCDTLECTARRNDAREKSKASGRVYDKLFVRHWDTWKDGRRSHLFSLPLSAGTAANAGSVARDLMKGMDADAPTKPMGDRTEFDVSPDGTQVVFAARDMGAKEAWSTNVDLFLAPIDGRIAPRNLTPDNKGTDTQPTFSPDGRTLAYLSMPRAGYESDRKRVLVRTAADGKGWADAKDRELAPRWDRSADGLWFSRDGRTLYTTADDVGLKNAFAFELTTGAVRKIPSEGHVAWVGEAAGGRLLMARDSLTEPSDLWSMRTDGSDRRVVTRLNPEFGTVAVGDYEQFNFKGANNDTVHGFVVKPVNMDPRRKYPVALLIHGGPQGSFGNDWHYRWNPQVYAGHGYVAVMIDFHGSTGYGQAFTDSIRGDWGGKPFVDLKKGLDAALARYPFMDGSRVAALGASYGGFMINWIAGNWSDRFRCLVNHDGNLDERFAYFDTEELWFPEWEHGGPPWEASATYGKHNPIDHVGKWKTPMLVIHGGKDFRVVETQGLATFTALQRRGIPSKFLYFPDENHWVLKPQNSVQWHDAVLAWLDQWTGGGAAAR